MRAYRVEAVVQEDGSLILRHLPFRAGERVEVIVFAQTSSGAYSGRYSLRGTRVVYVDPMEPVAEEHWESIR